MSHTHSRNEPGNVPKAQRYDGVAQRKLRKLFHAARHMEPQTQTSR